MLSSSVAHAQVEGVSIDKQLITAQVAAGQTVELELQTTNNIEFQADNRPTVNYYDFRPSADETVQNEIIKDGSVDNGISEWTGGVTALLNLGKDQANFIDFSVEVPDDTANGTYTGVVAVEYKNAEAATDLSYTVVVINVGEVTPSFKVIEGSDTFFDQTTGEVGINLANTGAHHVQPQVLVSIGKIDAEQPTQSLELVSARPEGLYPSTSRIYRSTEPVNATLLELLDDTYKVVYEIKTTSSAGTVSDSQVDDFPGVELTAAETEAPQSTEAEQVAETQVSTQQQSTTEEVVSEVKDEINSNRLYYVIAAAVAGLLALVAATLLWRRRRKRRKAQAPSTPTAPPSSSQPATTAATNAPIIKAPETPLQTIPQPTSDIPAPAQKVQQNVEAMPPVPAAGNMIMPTPPAPQEAGSADVSAPGIARTIDSIKRASDPQPQKTATGAPPMPPPPSDNTKLYINAQGQAELRPVQPQQQPVQQPEQSGGLPPSAPVV